MTPPAVPEVRARVARQTGPSAGMRFPEGSVPCQTRAKLQECPLSDARRMVSSVGRILMTTSALCCRAKPQLLSSGSCHER